MFTKIYVQDGTDMMYVVVYEYIYVYIHTNIYICTYMYSYIIIYNIHHISPILHTNFGKHIHISKNVYIYVYRGIDICSWILFITGSCEFIQSCWSLKPISKFNYAQAQGQSKSSPRECDGFCFEACLNAVRLLRPSQIHLAWKIDRFRKKRQLVVET